MATLNLTKVWINRLDTGEAVSAQSAPGRTRAHSVAGDVRTYAGGRQRAIIAVGERGEFKVTLVLVSMAQITTLRAWIGYPVQLRDHRGQLLVGTYFEVPITEHRDNVDSYNVDITLRTLTVPDGV